MMNKILRRFCVTTPIMMSACAAAIPGSASGTTGPGAAYGPFLAARYADAQQDTGAAIHYYTEALAADPHNQALINEGFIAAVVSGNPAAPQLARDVGNNALATMLLGNQAALNGNFGAAAKEYAALPQDPLSSLLSPLLIAWAETGKGNEAAAIAGLQPLTTGNSPFAGIYLLNAALIADESHDMKNAVPLYNEVGTINAGGPNLRLAQIIASWDARQGNLAGAKSELDQMIDSHPGLDAALPALQANIAQPVISNTTDGLAEAYLTIAGSLNQPSQAVLRLTFLRFALDLRPDLSAARLLLANVLTGSGDPDAKPSNALLQQAVATLQPVPQGDPLYIPAAKQEAVLLAQLGETAQAVSLLNSLIAKDPTDIDSMENAGDILRANNQYSAAIPYYNRAIALLPNPPPTIAWTLYYDRGISIDQGGDWAKAEPDLKEALALAPNQPYVLNYIGYTWALRGENLPQALAMLNQAVSLAPKEGAIVDSLGFVNLKTGDTKHAIQLLIQAVEMSPDDAEVNAHLGDAFFANGQKLQAEYQWQRALSLKPDPKLQAEIVGKLKQFSPPA